MTEKAVDLSDFEIIRLLGEGGTARVYLARERDSNRPVAVKIPLESSDTEVHHRFDHLLNREYELIGGLNFPGLVRARQLVMTSDQIPALILEYCPHKSLQSLSGPLDPYLVANLISAISVNLYYLKLLRINHGDLKPDNIYLAGNDPGNWASISPLVKISDFSLGLRETEGSEKRLGLGTVGYMAPETISDRVLDHRSDLFSLGIIAYEMATGEHPFRDNRNDPVRINSKIKEFYPESPDKMNPGIPENLSDLIMALLSKEPEKRPLNGWEVCEKAEEIGASYRFRRIIRPKHLMTLLGNEPVHSFLSRTPFDFDLHTIENLDRLSEENRTSLRRLLELNFSRNNIAWSAGTLRLGSDSTKILWPRRLKKEAWERFLEFPYNRKRTAVKAAILGNLKDASRLGLINGNNEYTITYGTIKCLRGNLSRRTIKLQAKRLAESAKEKDECIDIAARMYIESENLDAAFHCSIEATRILVEASRHEEAYALLYDLKTLCRKLNDIGKLRRTLMELGDIQKKTGDASRAEKTYNEIIKTYSDGQNDRLLAETYKDLGDVYRIKQDFEAGLASLKKAEQIYSELDDQLELSHTLNNIGNILTINSDHDGAFSMYRKALRIQRTLNSTPDIALTLNNMAAYYFNKGRYDRVKMLFKLSLKINKEIGNSVEIARVQNNLGFINHELGLFAEAMESLMESQELSRKAGIKKELLFNLSNLTEVMLSAGRLRESLDFLKEGIFLADELADIPHKAFLLNNMAAVLKRMGYFGQAHERLLEALQLGNEIDDEEHPVVCLIRLADLYRIFGDKVKTGELITELFERGEKLGIKRAVITAHILKGILNEDVAELYKALEHSNKLLLERNSELIKLHIINYHLHLENLEFPQEWIDQTYKRFHYAALDIEKSECYNTIGRYYSKINDIGNAIRFFEMALRKADESSLFPEKMTAMRHLGRLAAMQNDYEKAFQYYRGAMEILKKIVGDIADENYRRGFLMNPDITAMSEELNSLRKKLYGKKEASPR